MSKNAETTKTETKTNKYEGKTKNFAGRIISSNIDFTLNSLLDPTNTRSARINK